MHPALLAVLAIAGEHGFVVEIDQGKRSWWILHRLGVNTPTFAELSAQLTNAGVRHTSINGQRTRIDEEYLG